MNRLAIQMLLGGRAKYIALVIGVATTAFLVTAAGSFFCGMMTRSFALIAETPSADVWVMDPAVQCSEETAAMPDSALSRVRSVDGVKYATPLLLASTDARFPNGRFQSLQVIGVDDPTLIGAPPTEDGKFANELRIPYAAIVAQAGTEEKLETPVYREDQWTHLRPHLGAPHRLLRAGDELLLNDHLVQVVGRAAALPRFPPRPLVYMTYSNALRVLPIERDYLTFVLVKAAKDVAPRELANRIEQSTGLRARSADDFKADTVKWYLRNCEDVGDVETMLSVAMLVGLGVTGVMLFLFTQDHLKYYAMLKAMGASSRQLISMLLSQVAFSSLLGICIGVGLCALCNYIVDQNDMPFRMMWMTPILGGVAVMLVGVVATAVSLRPVLKLEPAAVFKA